MIETREIAEINAAGGVGEMLGYFFDAEGQVLETTLTSRTLAMELDGPQRAELDADGIDRGVCLGDVCQGGPEPEACVDLLAERGWPVVLGNADAFVLDVSHGEGSPEDLSERPLPEDVGCRDASKNPRGAEKTPNNRVGTAYRSPHLDHRTSLCRRQLTVTSRGLRSGSTRRSWTQ